MNTPSYLLPVDGLAVVGRLTGSYLSKELISPFNCLNWDKFTKRTYNKAIF